MKTILKYGLMIIGAVAIGGAIVHGVKMGTDENYRTHINAAWGVEQTIEDETPNDETPEDETGDETQNPEDIIDPSPNPDSGELDTPVEDETTQE